MPYKQPSIKGLDKWTPEPDRGYHFQSEVIGENNIQVQCPYCLFQDKRYKFLIPKKNSNKPQKKTFQCPDCQVVMRFATLMPTLNMNIKAYAKWVYSVRPFDPGRLKWEKIKARLKESNLTGQFWDAYFAEKELYIQAHPEYYAEKLAEEYEKQCQNNPNGMTNSTT